MIEYLNRYSDTDASDKFGRWARIAKCNNITIGWIKKLEVDGLIKYTASCYFPTLTTDTANETVVCNSLQQAEMFIEERWMYFTGMVCEHYF